MKFAPLVSVIILPPAAPPCVALHRLRVSVDAGVIPTGWYLFLGLN